MSYLDISELFDLLPHLQAVVCQKIVINDALIEPIEIIAEDTGDADWCPLHRHTWYEFNYILDGTMHTGFGEGPLLEVGAGEFFIIPPGMEHSHRYNQLRPHEGLCLRWTVEHWGGMNTEYSGIFQKLTNLKKWKPGVYKDQYELGNLWKLIFEETSRNLHSSMLQMSLVKILLALTNIHQPNELWLETEPHSNAALLRKVEVYLNDSQDKKVDVHELATSLHMSYGHLARLYKRLTGGTITDRLLKIRLERSQELLIQTNYSINAIALKAGFNSLYTYSRAFKQFYGMSPTGYRGRRSQH